MTAIARWTGWVVLVATSFVAGSHAVYYLYHWEWVRAQLAATAFTATLVILCTRVLLTRLRAAQADLRHQVDLVSAAVAAGVRTTEPVPLGTAPAPVDGRRDGAQPDLAWLAAAFSPPRHGALLWPVALAGPALAGGVPAVQEALDDPQAAVFIPVLLGAGIAVALLAGLVEHLSTAVHRRPPQTTALPQTASPLPDAQRTAGRSAARPALAVTAGLLVAGGLAVGAIWSTAHYRPTELGAGTTRLTVDVRAQKRTPPAEQTVDLVGRFCSRHAISGVSVVDVEPAGPLSATLVVRPLLDAEGQGRLRGCLEDATLDRHVLTVVDVTLRPEATS
jgi:hypothetical protein